MDRSKREWSAMIRRPGTREAFAEVFGVGEAKLEQFADIFIAAIAGLEEA